METMTDLSRIECCERLNQTGLRLDRTAKAVFLPDCRGALTSEATYHSISTPTFPHPTKPLVYSPVVLSNVTSSPMGSTQAIRPLSPSPIRSNSANSVPRQTYTQEFLINQQDTNIQPKPNSIQMDISPPSNLTSPTQFDSSGMPWCKEQEPVEKQNHEIPRYEERTTVRNVGSPPRNFWSPATSALAPKPMIEQLNVCTDLPTRDAQTNSSTPLRSNRDPSLPKGVPNFLGNELNSFQSYGGIDSKQLLGSDSHPQACSSSSMDEEVAVQFESLQHSRDNIDELRLLNGFGSFQQTTAEECISSSSGSGRQHITETSMASQAHSRGQTTNINCTTPELTQSNATKEIRWHEHRQLQAPVDDESYLPATESDETSPTHKSDSSDFRQVNSQSAITPVERGCPISLTCSDLHSSAEDSDEGMSMAQFEQMTNSVQPDQTGLYFCHLCEFTGHSRQDFQDHLRSHYDYKCLKCDYTSRTEGRLKRHLKDFHSEVPPDNFSGKAIKPIRPKLQRCKQCNFMTETKDDFWRHLRVHIKEDKRLECSLCCFVTEYKHHLEYHMRNHMGSKPYKCPKCNYECVNKSMLNSHMKSHSNVYPYRCANCHYATKYCHSLKLHLAKHDHKPAVVLNADGSLPSYDNTAELMSLRRGPGVRHGSRVHSNDSALDLKGDGKPGCLPISPFTDPNFLSHSLMVRHLMNSVNTNVSNVEPFPPYNSPFPFAFNGNTLPPFPGFLFPNPLMDPSNHLANLFNPPKIAAPFADKPTHPRPESFVEAGGTMTLAENLSKTIEKPGSLSPYPNPSKVTNVCNVPTSYVTPIKASTIEPQTHTPMPAPMADNSFSWRHSSVDLEHTLRRGSQVMSPLEHRKTCLQDDDRYSKLTSPFTNVGAASKNGADLRRQAVKSEALEPERALDLSSKLMVDYQDALRENSKYQQKFTKQGMVPNDSRTVEESSRTKMEPTENNSSHPNCKLMDTENSSSDLDHDGQKTIEQFEYECRFCEIRFRQRALFDIHMGFHSHTDPYLCNRCGHQSRNPVDFFIHLGQMAHYS